MNTPDPIVYKDNVLVQRSRSGAEYLALFVNDEETPFQVSLTRYCVPGRCDTYSFDYSTGRSGEGTHLKYSSQQGVGTIVKSLKMAAVDLQKPAVIEMLVDAVNKVALYHGRVLIEELVRTIAPRSSCYRKLKATFNKVSDERRAIRLAKVPLKSRRDGIHDVRRLPGLVERTQPEPPFPRGTKQGKKVPGIR